MEFATSIHDDIVKMLISTTIFIFTENHINCSHFSQFEDKVIQLKLQMNLTRSESKR